MQQPRTRIGRRGLLAWANSSWTSGGWGCTISILTELYPWEGAHNTGGYAGSWSGASSWRHHALRFNGAGGSWQHFLNGTQNATINATINTDVAAATNAYFTLAGIKNPAGTVGSRTAPKMCDVRLYDIVLTDANISDIANGDWTRVSLSCIGGRCRSKRCRILRF